MQVQDLFESAFSKGVFSMDYNQIDSVMDKDLQELAQFALDNPSCFIPLVYSCGFFLCQALSQLDSERREDAP